MKTHSVSYIAIGITMWALLVIDRYSPGDISSGLFSALFVVVIEEPFVKCYYLYF